MTKPAQNRFGIVNRWISCHPILSFVLITFGFSYLVGGVVNFLVGSLNFEFDGLIGIYLPRVPVVIGPAIAALAVAFSKSGREVGLRLIKKLNPQKNELWWYAILPISGAAITFLSFNMAGLSTDELIELLVERWSLLVAHFIIQTLLVGIGEEFGWRGWLMPRLAKRFSLGTAMLILFVIWVLWHFPVLLMGPQVVLPWLLIAASVTIILTWIWLEFEGNVFILAVAHASINATQFFMENQLAPSNQELILDSWKISSLVYLVIGLVFLFRLRKTLIRKLGAK